MKYRLVEAEFVDTFMHDEHCKYFKGYAVQVKGWLFWHDVKIFVDEDTEYAKGCAEELLEMLEKDI